MPSAWRVVRAHAGEDALRATAAEEARLYEQGMMDIELQDGTTVYGIPVWCPIAATHEWENARFRPALT